MAVRGLNLPNSDFSMPWANSDPCVCILDGRPSVGPDEALLHKNVTTAHFCIERDVEKLTVEVLPREEPLKIRLTRLSALDSRESSRLRSALEEPPLPSEGRSLSIKHLHIVAKRDELCDSQPYVILDISDIIDHDRCTFDVMVDGISLTANKRYFISSLVAKRSAIVRTDVGTLNAAEWCSVEECKVDRIVSSGKLLLSRNTEVLSAELLPRATLVMDESIIYNELALLQDASFVMIAGGAEDFFKPQWNTLLTIQAKCCRKSANLKRVSVKHDSSTKPVARGVTVGVYIAGAVIASNLKIDDKLSRAIHLPSGSSMSDCEIADTKVKLERSSAVDKCSGSMACISANKALISGGSKGLRLLPLAEAEDDAYIGAMLDRIIIPVGEGALPLILSLSDAAVVNPLLPTKDELSKVREDSKRFAIDLINRIVQRKATYGFIRCRWAHLAASVRLHGTSDRLEKCLLWFLSLIGFGYRPGCAFIWWVMFVLLFALLGPSKKQATALDSATCFLHRAAAVAIEPAYFLKVEPRDLDYVLGVSGRERVVLRIASTALLANLVLSLARYTRTGGK